MTDKTTPATPEDGPPGAGGWQSCAEAMERERDHWRERAQTMEEHQRGTVWYWEGDGHDHPESMVNSLPVVIRADQLRALIASGVQALSAAPRTPTVEQVEDDVGMGHDAWDMVDPQELIGAVLRLSVAASPTPTPTAQAGGADGKEAWLVPCAHCGGENLGRICHKESQVIECQTCFARGPQADDANAAKAAWATRAGTPPAEWQAEKTAVDRTGCTAGTDEECTRRGCATNCPAVDTRITAIEQAIRDYHFALDNRKHGGIATFAAFTAILQAMDMQWTQGAEVARRSQAAQRGGA